MVDDEKKKRKHRDMTRFENHDDYMKLKHAIDNLIQRVIEDIRFDSITPGIIHNYGITICAENDGSFHIEEFEKYQENPIQEFHGFSYQSDYEQDAAIDIMEYQDYITVTLELFGVKKEDIHIHVVNRLLLIILDDIVPPHYEKIEIPFEISSQSVYYTYQNNILDITMRKE